MDKKTELLKNVASIVKDTEAKLADLKPVSIRDGGAVDSDFRKTIKAMGYTKIFEAIKKYKAEVKKDGT